MRQIKAFRGLVENVKATGAVHLMGLALRSRRRSHPA
jgi:hypothetical protein